MKFILWPRRGLILAGKAVRHCKSMQYKWHLLHMKFMNQYMFLKTIPGYTLGESHDLGNLRKSL